MNSLNVDADDFRDFRAEHDITQAELGSILKVSGNYIYQIEAGKKPVSEKIARKLHKIMRDHHIKVIYNGKELEHIAVPNDSNYYDLKAFHESIGEDPEREEDLAIELYRSMIDSRDLKQSIPALLYAVGLMVANGHWENAVNHLNYIQVVLQKIVPKK